MLRQWRRQELKFWGCSPSPPLGAKARLAPRRRTGPGARDPHFGTGPGSSNAILTDVKGEQYITTSHGIYLFYPPE